jgi:hypothetical protein
MNVSIAYHVTFFRNVHRTWSARTTFAWPLVVLRLVVHHFFPVTSLLRHVEQFNVLLMRIA